jgi:hypothetical protein
MVRSSQIKKRTNNISRTSRRKSSISSNASSTSKGGRTRSAPKKIKSIRSNSRNRVTRRTKAMTTRRNPGTRKKSAEKAMSHYPHKQQRQYEHIKESHLKRGTNDKRTKKTDVATLKNTRSMRRVTKH